MVWFRELSVNMFNKKQTEVVIVRCSGSTSSTSVGQRIYDAKRASFLQIPTRLNIRNAGKLVNVFHCNGRVLEAEWEILEKKTDKPLLLQKEDRDDEAVIKLKLKSVLIFLDRKDVYSKSQVIRRRNYRLEKGLSECRNVTSECLSGFVNIWHWIAQGWAWLGRWSCASRPRRDIGTTQLAYLRE